MGLLKLDAVVHWSIPVIRSVTFSLKPTDEPNLEGAQHAN